jgi:hypothetical protein
VGDGEEMNNSSSNNDVPSNGDQCSNSYSPICSRRSSVSSYVLRYVAGSASVYRAILSDALGEQPVPVAEGDMNERPALEEEAVEPGPEASTAILVAAAAAAAAGGEEVEATVVL